MESIKGIQLPGEDISAQVDESLASCLILEHFGLEVDSIEPLDGYSDRNFFFTAKCSENGSEKAVAADGYVFKVMDSKDSKIDNVIEGLQAIMSHVQKMNSVMKIQSWNPSKNGNLYEKANLKRSDGTTSTHALRVLTFLPGKLVKSIPCTKELLFDVGFKLGKIDQALLTFHHPAFDSHDIIWHINMLPALRRFLFAIPSEDFINGRRKNELISDMIEFYEKEVVPLYPLMTRSQIHGDFNEDNLILDDEHSVNNVGGLLDFGDTSYSFLIFDVAIAIACMMLQKRSPECFPDIDVGGHLLKGYLQTITLNEHDWNALIPSICARLAISLVMGIYSYQIDPSNTYLLTEQERGWVVLSQLWETDFCTIRERWKVMLES